MRARRWATLAFWSAAVVALLAGEWLVMRPLGRAARRIEDACHERTAGSVR